MSRSGGPSCGRAALRFCRTDADARGYHLAYSRAISAIADHCKSDSVAENPGISVKLSALHPRYEVAQEARVIEELVPRVRALALLAKSAGMGFNIDAEEADRLSLSLDVISAVLAEPALAGWEGFGVVVQAFGQRAPLVLDYLYDLATRLDRKIMVRLVKGAYWDAEIKRAQVEASQLRQKQRHIGRGIRKGQVRQRSSSTQGRLLRTRKP